MVFVISQGVRGSPGAYGPSGDPGIHGIKGNVNFFGHNLKRSACVYSMPKVERMNGSENPIVTLSYTESWKGFFLSQKH